MELEFVNWNSQRAGGVDEPAVITGELHSLSLPAEKVHRRQVERIERPHRFRKRFQRP